RSRIGDANVFVGTEGFAGHDGDMFIVEQLGGEVHGRPNAGFAERRADVGIGVESSARSGAFDAGNLVERRDDVVAAAAILGEHAGYGVLRAVQSFNGGLLDDRRRVRSRVALQVVDGRDQLLRP